MERQAGMQEIWAKLLNLERLGKIVVRIASQSRIQGFPQHRLRGPPADLDAPFWRQAVKVPHRNDALDSDTHS